MGMIGRYLDQLTPGQRERVVTTAMESDSTWCRCLVGTANEFAENKKSLSAFYSLALRGRSVEYVAGVRFEWLVYRLGIVRATELIRHRAIFGTGRVQPSARLSKALAALRKDTP